MRKLTVWILLAAAMIPALTGIRQEKTGDKPEVIRAAVPETVQVMEREPEPETETPSGNVYRDAVPMSYGYQCAMQDACRRYGVDYPLALGVAEIESHFDFAADSGTARGIMQINPVNDDWLRAAGIDPDSKSGNIQAGVYMLSRLLEQYGDVHKALMAYNCGETGAAELWAEGYETTKYSRAVIAAAGKWEGVVKG